MKFYQVLTNGIHKGEKRSEWFTNRTLALTSARKTAKSYRSFLKEHRKWEKKVAKIKKMSLPDNEERVQLMQIGSLPKNDLGFEVYGGYVEVFEKNLKRDITNKNLILRALNGDLDIFTSDQKESIWEKKIL